MYYNCALFLLCAEENYGSIEVIEVGGAWRFPEDGPSTDLKTGEDSPPIKPIVTEPPLIEQGTYTQNHFGIDIMQ